jgi:hypothetical protein
MVWRSKDDLGSSGDPIDCSAAPRVRAAVIFRIVDDDMLVIEHEFHIEIWVPIEARAIRGLLAAAITRFDGRARDSIGAPQHVARQIRVIEINRAESPRDFERPPTASAQREGLRGDHTGVCAPRGIVEAFAAERIARFYITAVEIEFGARLSSGPTTDARRGRCIRSCIDQSVDDVVVIFPLDEEFCQAAAASPPNT